MHVRDTLNPKTPSCSFISRFSRVLFPAPEGPLSTTGLGLDMVLAGDRGDLQWVWAGTRGDHIRCCIQASYACDNIKVRHQFVIFLSFCSRLFVNNSTHFSSPAALRPQICRRSPRILLTGLMWSKANPLSCSTVRETLPYADGDGLKADLCSYIISFIVGGIINGHSGKKKVPFTPA